LTFFSNLLEDIRSKLNFVDIYICVKLLQLEEGVEIAGEQSNINSDPRLGRILVEMGNATVDVIDKAFSRQSARLGDILIESGDVEPGAVQKALDIQNKLQEKLKFSQQHHFDQNIRVDIGRVDKLINIVGELVTLQAMLLNSPDIKGLNLPDFSNTASILQNVTDELQHLSMSMRMVSLDGLFHRIHRLVRELSRKFNKKVILKMNGKETEMDRKIIEKLIDPLTHVIRNAFDHGIENEDERVKAGKPAAGVIVLHAGWEGKEIKISVKDDGKGLDKEKIIRRAIEKKLLDSDHGELTDQAIFDFLFIPGFSTAETITEMSGRGVGMDVVQENINKLKGRIEIHSEKGKGSEVIFRIPLTLAILEVLTIQIGGNFYSIPVSDVREITVVKDTRDISNVGAGQTIRLRDEVIPLIKLHSFFNIQNAETDILKGVIVIVSIHNNLYAFMADSLLETHQVVIKSLEKNYTNIIGISGCSILSNSCITLIIDCGLVIEHCNT
jgi:two-component system chemotaxis sensor kinase CheA